VKEKERIEAAAQRQLDGKLSADEIA